MVIRERNILRYTKTFLIFGILSLMVLAGCGPLLTKEQPKPVVQQGGEIVYASIYEPNTLNPIISDLVATHEVGQLIFSGLLVMNDKGEWEPDLAESVPTLQNGGISADGRTVTYKLKKGITWHDGQAFTAADVKFTWQLIMNRKTNAVSREGYEQIIAVDTPDPNTVVVRFKEYYLPYLTLFSTILPQHLLANVDDLTKSNFNREPVGTGPFKVKEWMIADSITLIANTNYYRGKPVLDKIHYKFIPDYNILLSQIKAGEIDIVSNVPFAQIDSLRGIQEANIVISPGTLWEHMELNLDSELFKDIKVRQALAAALDRQLIVEGALKNTAIPIAADQHPLSWAYDSNLTVLTRNVEQARSLLQEAGWQIGSDGIYVKNGRKLSFTLTTTDKNKTRELIGSVIAQEARDAGIEVIVKPVSVTSFFNEVLRLRRFDAALFSVVVGADPDNYNMWNSKMIPDAKNNYSGQNYSGWRNAEVDRLTEVAVKAVSLEERKQAYIQIQEFMQEEDPVIPLCFLGQINVVKKNIANFKPNPLHKSLWNAWQWGMVK